MSLARRARRIAVKALYGAAFGGGGLGVVGATGVGLLAAEAKLARRVIGVPTAQPPAAEGLYGPQFPGAPIRFVVIGDSSAAGLGVHLPHQTPGALLANGLAAVAERPVRLRNVARSGAQSGDLEAQVGLALADEPEVALIMIGANDVTHRVRPAASVRLLAEAVRQLREHGCEVVVGTCPDLGTIKPIAQPLRLLARRWSRQLAAAQTIAVVEAGGRTVSLGDLLGPEFDAQPSRMFSDDRFHPSAAGYAQAASALLPSLCAALGVWPEGPEGPVEPAPDVRRGEGVLPVAVAAAEAATEAGTEVARAKVGQQERGRFGRWALLRRRQRHPVPGASEPGAAGGTEGAEGAGGSEGAEDAVGAEGPLTTTPR